MEDALQAIAHLIALVFLVGTGEVVWWAVSFGRHKPRWDFYSRERSGDVMILTEISAYIGGAFWLAIGGCLWLLLS